MRDGSLKILTEAINGDGFVRVPLERADDPNIVELVALGFIKPIPEEGMVTELLYRVDTVSADCPASDAVQA